MPRYFFNIRDDSRSFLDREGMDLPNLEAAKHEADASAREILIDAIETHREVDHRRIEVADETGAVVEVVLLKDLAH